MSKNKVTVSDSWSWDDTTSYHSITWGPSKCKAVSVSGMYCLSPVTENGYCAGHNLLLTTMEEKFKEEAYDRAMKGVGK